MFGNRALDKRALPGIYSSRLETSLGARMRTPSILRLQARPCGNGLLFSKEQGS